jgi:hypothetical protein
MKIVIQFIEPKMQRYPTCGDYWIDENGNWQIRISQMTDTRSMMLVLLHELAEMILVTERKIPIESIDQFDIEFESTRKPGDESEPGDQDNCPYREEHTISTAIERMMSEALRVRWRDHERIVNESLE